MNNDRDRIFVGVMNALLSNPNIIKSKSDLNYDSSRKQVVEMGKMLTNSIMQEITDEEDDD